MLRNIDNSQTARLDRSANHNLACKKKGRDVGLHDSSDFVDLKYAMLNENVALLVSFAIWQQLKRRFVHRRTQSPQQTTNA